MNAQSHIAPATQSHHRHAVIADGAAMHRVPGSLRFLTKTCRDANVPLYILNDPRSWGSNTHSNLLDALVDMRKTIPANIVRSALDLREGSAFERGRMVGRWEKEMAWQAWDAGRMTREAWKDAKERWRRERGEDWSELSEDEIRKMLADRKVIMFEEDGDGVNKDNDNTDNDEKTRRVRYSEGFIDLCRHCVDGQSDMETPTDQTKK